ncbi:DUF397 domain-containing protein [Kitasatospora sp. NPDC056076]|uniref:DUF397 domain-containing protein n=1 Tax=Kitasatospora sp. NPDC056076 TaxID=3345703 RepID=UPI0035E2C534
MSTEVEARAAEKAELYALDLSQFPRWRSPRGTGDDYVEIVLLPEGARAIVDPKRPDIEPLRYNAAEWAAFTEGVRRGLI